MKIIIYIIPFIILLAVILGVVYYDSSLDVSPSLNSEKWQENIQSDTIPPPGFFPTIFNFNFANIPNLNAGSVGAMLLYGKYYMNRWNSNECYILPNTGPNGGPSINGMRTVTYTGNIRDMTTDGRYLYGGKAMNILYKMDTNMTLLNQFTMTGNIRAITWDPNRKAFWYSDFAGNITCRDTANNLKHTIVTTLAAKYGLAFDTSTFYGDSAFVFCWDQGTGTGNNLVRYYVSTPSPYQVNNWLFVLPQGVGIAGGAEIVWDSSSYYFRKKLLLNYQNFALVGYRLSPGPDPISNLHEVVRDYKLYQNYPNPFNPVTRISFILSKEAFVKLEVFNTLGEKVSTIFSGHTQAGEHEYLFDALKFSSGVYYYRITVDDTYTTTKKMILIK